MNNPILERENQKVLAEYYIAVRKKAKLKQFCAQWFGGLNEVITSKAKNDVPCKNTDGKNRRRTYNDRSGNDFRIGKAGYFGRAKEYIGRS